jgi:integrase
MKYRRAGYYHCFDVGKAVGYIPKISGPGAWVARVTQHRKLYREETFALADDYDRSNGATVLTFPEAKARAKELCSRPHLTKNFSAQVCFGRERGLRFCPFGDVYTVGHALSEYIEWKRTYGTAASFQTALSNINYYIFPELGTIRADELNHIHIRRMMERIEATPANSAKATSRLLIDPNTLSPDARRKRRVSANNAVSILRAALLLAWEAGKIVDDRGWRRPFRFKDGVRPRTDYLTRQQFESLMAVADAEIKGLLIGLFYTGCRITELLSIQAGDLLADRLAVYIRPVKKVEGHYVALPRTGYDYFLALAKNRGSTDCIFTRADGSSWTRYAMQIRYRAALEKAGLPNRYVFHTLRHTYASLRLQEGISPIAVARQLGHRHVRTVMQTYAHCNDDVLDEEIRAKFIAPTL